MKTDIRNIFAEIADILTRMENETDIYDFCRDIMTEEEMRELVQRWEIAKMLEKKVSYVEIERITGASSTTIARVQKYLKGENRWYQKALSMLKAVSHPHHTDHRPRSD